MNKTCTLCGETIAIDGFYKAPACKDGHAGQCKDCVKRRARQRQIAKAAEIRAFDRERSKLPHRVAQRAANFTAYAHRHPDRRAAHVAVGNAVRDGRVRKMDCAFCGAEKTIAHHHDYSKPLDVTWLCQPCHHRFHALEAMAKYERSQA